MYSSSIPLLLGLEQVPRTTLTPGPKIGVHFTVRFWRLIEARVIAAWTKCVIALPTTSLQRKVKATSRFNYDAIRKTAFFIAREFYTRRRQELRLASPTFERFTLSNTAAAVRLLLTTDRDWLVLIREAVEGRRSRTFKIADDLWPPRRGEQVLVLPP